MNNELEVFKENNIWYELYKECLYLIKSKWVFKQKSGNEFKARLVLHGFQQDCQNKQYDMNAPIAKLPTLR